MSNDRSSIRLVIIFLGSCALSGIVGIMLLASMGKTVPAEAGFGTLIGASLGALGSLLSSTSSKSSVPVTVDNKDSDPIPVEDSKDAGDSDNPDNAG